MPTRTLDCNPRTHSESCQPPYRIARRTPLPSLPLYQRRMRGNWRNRPSQCRLAMHAARRPRAYLADRRPSEPRRLDLNPCISCRDYGRLGMDSETCNLCEDCNPTGPMSRQKEKSWMLNEELVANDWGCACCVQSGMSSNPQQQPL